MAGKNKGGLCRLYCCLYVIATVTRLRRDDGLLGQRHCDERYGSREDSGYAEFFGEYEVVMVKGFTRFERHDSALL